MSKKPVTSKNSQRKNKTTPRWFKFAPAAALVVVAALFMLSQHLRQSIAQANGSSVSTAKVPPMPSVGSEAPQGTFKTIAGKSLGVSTLKGKPTLVWFVTTWCTTCQASTTTLAKHIGVLSADGVHVVELELYNNLGSPGPSLKRFGPSYAGSEFGNADWTWGTASKVLSERYDPAGYLDVYYLLDAKGRIRYINSSPVETMPDLMKHVVKVGQS